MTWTAPVKSCEAIAARLASPPLPDCAASGRLEWRDAAAPEPRGEDAVAAHPRVDLLEADTTAPATLAEIAERTRGRRVMLHLDADHNARSVLAELRGLGDLVAPGCYAVVADTVMGGHPIPFRWNG